MLSHLTTLLLQAAPLSSTLNQTSPLSATLTQTAVAAGPITPVVTITDTQIAANIPPLPSLVVPIYVIVVLLGLAFAIGLPLLVARRYGVSFRYMMWGALVGFASQSVVLPLVQQTLGSSLGLSQNSDYTSLFGFAMLSAAIAALAGVAGFYLINQLVLKDEEDRNWSAGVMTGVGAGVILFALNFLLNVIGGLTFYLTRWPPKAEDIAQLTPDAKTQLPAYIAALSGFEPLASLWLNLALAVLQIAAAVLVVTYFRRREWLWLAGAAGLLFLGYAAGDISTYILGNGASILIAVIIEVVIYALLAAVAIYLVFRVYEPPDVKPVLKPATIVDVPAEPGDEPIMSDHPELEAPRPAKRRRRR